MKSKFFVLMMSILLLSSVVEAAKIDVYRDMLSSGQFTLKYTITEPPVRVTNKEATLQEKNLFGRFTMEDTSAVRSRNLVDYKGIVVCDGANKYTESPNQLDDEWISCMLKQNGDIFRFRYSKKDGNKKTYHSRYGKNSVAANVEEYLGELSTWYLLNQEYSYGTPSVTKALAPILPPDKIIATPFTPEYKLIGTGTLDDGLTFEDFFGSKNGFNCAIRYYFDGDKLVKIALFDYRVSDSHVQAYEKCVITVDEFSPTPDQNYLQLPAELKDKTKR